MKLNIEDKKGIVIAPSGDFLEFGTLSYGNVSSLTDDNYHDTALKKDVIETSWFKELEKELNFEYNPNETIYKQNALLSAKGIITILNGSTTTPQGDEYNVYCIYTPKTLTENQQVLLEENYQDIKELIKRKEAYFEATAFDEDCEYVWNDFVYSIDDFYNRMNLKKPENNFKTR